MSTKVLIISHVCRSTKGKPQNFPKSWMMVKSLLLSLKPKTTAGLTGKEGTSNNFPFFWGLHHEGRGKLSLPLVQVLLRVCNCTGIGVNSISRDCSRLWCDLHLIVLPDECIVQLCASYVWSHGGSLFRDQDLGLACHAHLQPGVNQRVRMNNGA